MWEGAGCADAGLVEDYLADGPCLGLHQKMPGRMAQEQKRGSGSEAAGVVGRGEARHVGVPMGAKAGPPLAHPRASEGTLRTARL